MFTYSELLKNRKLGLSSYRLGKKLGIDPSKDKVRTLYKVLHENLEDLPVVESLTSLNCVSPCILLRYMFDSELDQVANCALPSASR